MENSSVPISSASGEGFVPDPSDFLERLIRGNGLAAAGFAGWDFLPGMRFRERDAWWRGGGERGVPHEGLDLRRYRRGDGRLAVLGAGARVPVIYAGELVAIVEDFLGSSVFVAHKRLDGAGRRLHTVYGHILAREGLAPRSSVRAGEVIGVIAAPAGRKIAVPPHLHITLALIAREGGLERLDWDVLRDRRRVVLLDPLAIVGALAPR